MVNGDIAAGGDTDEKDNLSDEVSATVLADKILKAVEDDLQQQQLAGPSFNDEPFISTGAVLNCLVLCFVSPRAGCGSSRVGILSFLAGWCIRPVYSLYSAPGDGCPSV